MSELVDAEEPTAQSDEICTEPTKQPGKWLIGHPKEKPQSPEKVDIRRALGFHFKE